MLENSPQDVTLPFFSYGLFKRGELAHYRIQEFVLDVKEDVSVSGALYDRDGFPLLVPDESQHAQVFGQLIRFKHDKVNEAYELIASVEPSAQYKWETTSTLVTGEQVNVLVGKQPQKGGKVIEGVSHWTGADDPMFSDSLLVIDWLSGSLEIPRGHCSPSRTRFFVLPSAYLFLWTAIERYATLRFGFHLEPMAKVRAWADEDCFRRSLEKLRPRKRLIFRTDRLDSPERLDFENPWKAAKYYYQMRSNIAHRGKAFHLDERDLESSLDELTQIFRDTLAEAGFAGFND